MTDRRGSAVARELKEHLRWKRRQPPPVQTRELNKVLVRVPSTVSEAVFAEPAVRSIRLSFPEAAVWVAGPKWAPQLYAAGALFEQVVPLPAEENLKDMRGLLLELRAERFAVGITLDDSIASSLLLATARIPERWGYAREGPHLLLTKSVKQAANPAAAAHRVEHYRRLVRELGLKDAAGLPTVEPGAEDLAAAREELRAAGWDGGLPLVALAPGGGQGPAGRWPAGRFAETAALIRKERPVFTMFVATEDDADAAGLAGGLPAPACGVGPGLGPGRLAAFLSLASLLITNDSECLHLADALGRPVAALFGPTDPRVTGPLKSPAVVLVRDTPCRPCSYVRCPYDHRCMRGIAVSEVVSAALSLPWATEQKAG